jgi:hypothetical protein
VWAYNIHCQKYRPAVLSVEREKIKEFWESNMIKRLEKEGYINLRI